MIPDVIVVGVLVGPFGLGAAVPEHRWLEWVTISNPKGIAPFAELGIILLLFSIGLELSYAHRLSEVEKAAAAIVPSAMS